LKRVASKLTYANVMVTILAFVVLAGGTAFAAGQLGKNTVGSKQLKKNAVTAAKIKNNAVTTAKIKNGAVSGAKINLGSLGTVPSATTAATAATAATAGNANTVGGQTITKIFTKIPKGATATIATFGSFKLVAECSAATGNVELFELISSAPSADLLGASVGNAGASSSVDIGADAVIELDNGNGIDNDRGVASFTGALSDGTVINGMIGFNDTLTFNEEDVCSFYGRVTT
jgi:hypothetical protein